MLTQQNKIRVLIVDDSDSARAFFRLGLESCAEVTIIGEAANAYQARDILVNQRPDVIILDIAMPKLNGIDFLKKFMPKIPTPTIMVSASLKDNCSGLMKPDTSKNDKIYQN